MAREILFRGKRINRNGEWGYGDLRRYGGNTWVFPHDNDAAYDADMVDPETVGEFTGVADKNGKQIFEGDIVDCWSQGRHCTNGIVTWMENRVFIVIKGKDGHVIDNWHIMPNNNGIDEGVSVIGNIYDNPELLCQN